MSDREVNPRHLQRALRVQNLTHSVTDSSYNLYRGTADANRAELLSLTHDECLLRVLKVRVLYIFFLHRFYMRCAAAAARLDVYTLVSVCSMALLLAALAHAVLPRPRRRSTPAAVRHKPRSSSTPWSTAWTRTLSAALLLPSAISPSPPRRRGRLPGPGLHPPPCLRPPQAKVPRTIPSTAPPCRRPPQAEVLLDAVVDALHQDFITRHAPRRRHRLRPVEGCPRSPAHLQRHLACCTGNYNTGKR